MVGFLGLPDNRVTLSALIIKRRRPHDSCLLSLPADPGPMDRGGERSCLAARLVRPAPCDNRRLIWVDNAKPEEMAGIPPAKIASDVDFFAVHVYPERGKVKVALDSLTRYKIGKPVVVEETSPLKCSVMDLSDFIQSSRNIASGWLGH